LLLTFPNTMRSHVFALASLLLGSAVATDNWANINHDLKALKARQDESFVPGKNQGTGATCADAFGDGFLPCGTGNDCYNPTEKESCCSEGYPCPSGSFCLTQGYCCPDGIDPATCAKNNGVTWPPPSSAPASSSSAAYTPPVYSSSAPVYPSSTYKLPVTTTYATSVGTITICPSSSVSRTANGTVTATHSPVPTKAPIFTGAASPQNVAGGAVALLGFLGFLQNVL